VHITDPFTFRPVRVLLFEIEIFSNLIPHSHNNICFSPLQR
jgi:hypothetical protein